MSLWSRLILAWRFMRRELVSGELTLLALALVVAVSAMSSGAFFSERVARGLAVRASQLLAADLVLDASAPLPPALRQEALRRGLAVSGSITFPSMVMTDNQVALANFKAVEAGYPLRGQVSVRMLSGQIKQGSYRPDPGTAWADLRLMTRLGLKLGDRIMVGQSHLQLSGEMLREPDAAISLYNFIPRLILNQADLSATQLIQPGTRAHWRLMVAGDAGQVTAYASWLQGRMPAGARLENVEEARPEVREAMNRARRFLGLTAMLTVALSAAAVSLAVRRYLMRHWQAVAVLRCLGLTASEVSRLFAGLFLLLALVCGVVGTLAGFGLQAGLARLALADASASLPSPGGLVWLLAPLSAVLLLSGLALPPLMAVRRVSPLVVLRADQPPSRSGLLAPLLAVLSLLALAAWQVADVGLALWMFAGMSGFFAISALLAWGMVAALRYLSMYGSGIGWRFGVAALARRPWLAVIQVVALSVGLMALLTLTVVRNDLLASWRASLPASAPNQFVLNLQPQQQSAFLHMFSAAQQPQPELAPMLRARLLQINGRAVNPADYRDDEARRLAEREFNLSWRDTLPVGNQLTSGRWWGARASGQFSVERGLADKLGISLGDSLSFDVAGTRYDGRVTSLRAVEWGSFRVNFFVLAPPGMFAGQSVSLVSSFHLGATEQAFASQLVRQFPNITMIDVSEILTELRDVVDRLAHAIESLFALSLLAGLLVLWAALSATRDERLFDAGLLRALGASRRQVRNVVLAELAWLGAFTGLLAGCGAMALGSLAAIKLFNLPFALDLRLLPLGIVLGMLLVPLAGWPLIRRVLRQAPAVVLRSL
jgi:putative ABC transport system permease protein